MSQFYATHVG